MVKIRFCPGVGVKYTIVSGHKFQHWISGNEYEVLEYDSRAGFKVKGPFGTPTWVSHSQLRKWFPNTDGHKVRYRLSIAHFVATELNKRETNGY